MKKNKEQSRMERLQNDVTEKGREIWLAGLGALATVEQEGTKLYSNLVDSGKEIIERSRKLEDNGARFLNDLIKRGERMEENGRKRLSAVAEDLSAKQDEVTNRLEDSVSTMVEKTLDRLDVPTRAETVRLTKKVEGLSKKVEALVVALEADNGTTTRAKAKAAAPRKTTARKASTTKTAAKKTAAKKTAAKKTTAKAAK